MPNINNKRTKFGRKVTKRRNVASTPKIKSSSRSRVNAVVGRSPLKGNLDPRLRAQKQRRNVHLSEVPRHTWDYLPSGGGSTRDLEYGEDWPGQCSWDRDIHGPNGGGYCDCVTQIPFCCTNSDCRCTCKNTVSGETQYNSNIGGCVTAGACTGVCTVDQGCCDDMCSAWCEQFNDDCCPNCADPDINCAIPLP